MTDETGLEVQILKCSAATRHRLYYSVSFFFSILFSERMMSKALQKIFAQRSTRSISQLKQINNEIQDFVFGAVLIERIHY
jgi:predicted PurR-regulated permease PerM